MVEWKEILFHSYLTLHTKNWVASNEAPSSSPAFGGRGGSVCRGVAAVLAVKLKSSGNVPVCGVGYVRRIVALDGSA